MYLTGEGSLNLIVHDKDVGPHYYNAFELHDAHVRNGGTITLGICRIDCRQVSEVSTVRVLVLIRKTGVYDMFTI